MLPCCVCGDAALLVWGCDSEALTCQFAFLVWGCDSEALTCQFAFLRRGCDREALTCQFAFLQPSMRLLYDLMYLIR